MYVMETSRVVVHQPVESACIVFNMDGFTLKNMVCILIFFFVGGGENIKGGITTAKGTSVTININLKFFFSKRISILSNFW